MPAPSLAADHEPWFVTSGSSCPWLHDQIGHRLHRGYAVAAPGEVAVLATGPREPAYQLGAELLRRHHRVHDQLTGEPDDVDVGLVGRAPVGHERLPLGLR